MLGPGHVRGVSSLRIHTGRTDFIDLMFIIWQIKKVVSKNICV